MYTGCEMRYAIRYGPWYHARVINITLLNKLYVHVSYLFCVIEPLYHMSTVSNDICINSFYISGYLMWSINTLH